jgi:hypothetical protein
MSDRLYSAIVSRLDDDSLVGTGNTFAGNIWFEEATSKTPFPYITMEPLAWADDGGSSDTDYEVQAATLRIIYKEDNSTDPVALGGTYQRSLITSLMSAPLSIPSSEGRIWQSTIINKRITRDIIRDQRVWVAEVAIESRLGRPKGALRNLP